MKNVIWQTKQSRLTFSISGFAISQPSGEAALSLEESANLKFKFSKSGISLVTEDSNDNVFGYIPFRAIFALVRTLRLARKLLEFSKTLEWFEAARLVITRGLENGIWITRETADRLEALRPASKIQYRNLTQDIFSDVRNLEEILSFCETNFVERIEKINSVITTNELLACEALFNGIETSPLSDEQSRAVICCDNRVHLLAAAGSGKTSVIVAKAAYVIQKNIAPPSKILVLAFNRAAAEELSERIHTRLTAAGIASTGITVSTFHAFGLSVIGASTGRKPRIARWIEQSDERKVILTFVREIGHESASFQFQWDMFRLVYGRGESQFDDERLSESNQTEKNDFISQGGIKVKSYGEFLIANFLYFNNVEFDYERDFVFDVSSADKSQYRPDFYYPAADVWHEHWALNDGEVPRNGFEKYEEGRQWKRDLHEKFKTQLLETYAEDVVFGDGLEQLETQLKEKNIELNWEPTRQARSEEISLSESDLADLMLAFMKHLKSNSLTRGDVETRLNALPEKFQTRRTTRFLDLFWPIFDKWQEKLKEELSIDFEDMLILASEQLESNAYQSPFDVVMVDEFQDSSQSRARLIKALLQDSEKQLFAVGDDWQSINRFAGSDVQISKSFHQHFGEHEELALTLSYRCSQEICDVSSQFVTKNPTQLKKAMNSSRPPSGRPVRIVRTIDEAKELQDLINDISTKIENGVQRSIFVLGRYNWLANRVVGPFPNNVKVSFKTIHSSKGLEADYVIVLGLSSDRFGFPSRKSDDPVLRLVQPKVENYRHAEERRLMYVALTRARRQVFLLAPFHDSSKFVDELVAFDDVLDVASYDPYSKKCTSCNDGQLITKHSSNGRFLGCTNYPGCTKTEQLPCPRCENGKLRTMKSKNGLFMGCSLYPRCRYTEKIEYLKNQQRD